MKLSPIVSIVVLFVIAALTSSLLMLGVLRTDAAPNDFVRVLQREQAFEKAHPTYFAVVYVVTGHVPAAQGQIVEIGADYFCITHSISRECFLLDKVSSVDFFDGQ